MLVRVPRGFRREPRGLLEARVRDTEERLVRGARETTMRPQEGEDAPERICISGSRVASVFTFPRNSTRS